jgi:hypothetical protein
MSARTPQYFASLEEIRVELVARIRARRTEIQDAIFARVRAMAGPSEVSSDAEYVAGLRAAVIEALDHAVASIEHGDEWSAPIPSAAVAQARRAARNSVSLDTVLRRYAAGDRQLVEFIMDVADEFPAQELRYLLQTHGLQVDRFMAAVAAEYMDELERVARSPEQRVADAVEKLLVGEPVDTSKLDYEFEGYWHLGIIVTGTGAARSVKLLADTMDRELLSMEHSEQTVWAWLGGRRRLVIDEVEQVIAKVAPQELSLAIGEPAKGLDGWRLTHRQAQAALWVALRKPQQQLTRYADDLLLAAALRDDVLARSLNEIYFLPLCDQRDGGIVARDTLRAYFTTGRNAATAAALLGVDRHTVQRRLRKIEDQLGRLMHTCYPELEIALRLRDLDDEVDSSVHRSERQ